MITEDDECLLFFMLIRAIHRRQKNRGNIGFTFTSQIKFSLALRRSLKSLGLWLMCKINPVCKDFVGNLKLYWFLTYLSEVS